MPNYTLTALPEFSRMHNAMGEVIPSGWLDISDSSETLIMLILAFLVLLLSGILLYVRRMRIALQQEHTAVKNSEDHLRTIGDAVLDITIFQLEHDTGKGTFRFAFISNGVESMLGIERSRLLKDAQMALDLVYEDDVSTLKNILTTSTETPEPIDLELRVLDMDGSYKWLHINAMPQFIGKRLIWDGFVIDISDKKNAEQSVAEESRNFQNLFETIDDFLLVCDMEGKLLHTNPSLRKRLDYSKEELASMSIFELYSSETHPEIYRSVAALRSEPTATCDLPLQMKNGGYILAEMNLFQGTWKQNKAIFGVARDVARYQQTEIALRESQKMLQLIIDTIPMSIFWKDKDSVYLGCNQHFIRECQLNNIDQVVGKTPYDLFDPSIAPDIVERDQGVINTNQQQLSHLESHTRADGSIGRREISLIPLRNATGKAVGVLGVWRDVSEQNQAEDRLKRTLEDMERFNQLMRGRERRTLELKDEINDLLTELGKPKKYRTTAEDMPS